MSSKILVTGGAGFIGSYIVDQLIEEGNEVIILDNLEPQVHKAKPEYLNAAATFVEGNVLDYELFKKHILESDIIFHEAAMVGVGQSMYQVDRYMDTNVMGTSHLLNVLANENHNVKKVMVAASMSSYGEGAYKTPSGEVVYPNLRPESQMKEKKWEPLHNGEVLTPIATPETKPYVENSIYAISKSVQEKMVLNVCNAYGIPAVALRYFNVYGPRQSLSNPYTGVAAIFMSRLMNNNAPAIFEDGLQTRDFISVKDIAAANVAVMKSSNANGEMFNVGTGSPRTIKSIAETLAKLLGKDLNPAPTNTYRKGDVRHCFADNSKIASKVEWEPKVSFEEGMRELIEWSASQDAVDNVDSATKELRDKGLIE